MTALFIINTNQIQMARMEVLGFLLPFRYYSEGRASECEEALSEGLTNGRGRLQLC